MGYISDEVVSRVSKKGKVEEVVHRFVRYDRCSDDLKGVRGVLGVVGIMGWAFEGGKGLQGVITCTFMN